MRPQFAASVFHESVYGRCPPAAWPHADRAKLADKYVDQAPCNPPTAACDEDDDDLDHEFFLAAIEHMEREHREGRGVYARWPLREFGQWAARDPKDAEKALAAFIFTTGISLGVLWHLLSAWFVSP